MVEVFVSNEWPWKELGTSAKILYAPVDAGVCHERAILDFIQTPQVPRETLGMVSCF
jgi:hypothetical protein